MGLFPFTKGYTIMAGADKARSAARAVAKGTAAKGKAKVRTSATFHRPKTLKLARKPLYPRRSQPRRNKMDDFAIVKFPLTTEGAMKKLDDNILTFIVHKRSNKNQIKLAIRKMFEVEVLKINTLITARGEKKAFIRLTTDHD